MKTILSIAFTSVVLMLSAQAQNHEVIAASGDSYDNGTYTLSWTLGEVVSETMGNSTITLTQGFQQPSLVITSIEDVENSQLEVTAYPNPTLNILYMEIMEDDYNEYTFELYNLEGTLLMNQNIVNKTEELNLTGYASAQYILILKNKSGVAIKSFKIMKN
jgi:hypothetical protein